MRASTWDRSGASGAWVCSRISARESSGILSDKIPCRFHPVSEFVFGTYDAAYVQIMYEEYLRDPNSVGQEWRGVFSGGQHAAAPAGPPDARGTGNVPRETVQPPTAAPPPP